MRSIRDDAVSEDLNSRARIRDAAIVLFGRDGFGKAGIRAVAAYAGVSPGLVIHHFGSKDGLRAACDAHVLSGTSARAKSKTEARSMRLLLQEYLARPRDYLPEIAYIRRCLADDSDAGQAFFDTLVDQTAEFLAAGMDHGTIRQINDVRATAVVLASHSLAILAFGPHIARNLGTAELSPGMVRRLAVPAMELYTRALYTDTRFLDAVLAAFGPNPPE